jgi:serine/threonine-protein kinase
MLGASFSHYRITGKLGEGGMGMVYVAEDTALGREVAIKFPRPEDVSSGQLLREARAASTLSHPHIASIHDCGEHNGQPYVVMELVRGRSLDNGGTGRCPCRRASR